MQTLQRKTLSWEVKLDFYTVSQQFWSMRHCATIVLEVIWADRVFEDKICLYKPHQYSYIEYFPLTCESVESIKHNAHGEFLKQNKLYFHIQEFL